MPIETVFLDAGGVLVFPNWVRVADTLARHGLTVSPAALADADQRVKHELDCRVAPASLAHRDIEQEFFELVLARVGVPVGPASLGAITELRRYHVEHNLWETVPSDVPPGLARLRALGLRLVVVSNANGTLRDAFARVGLSGHVDLIVDSFEEGVSKPDRRLFEIALARSGSRRERTVHVGDVYQSDVVGARGAGLHTILLDALDLYRDVPCLRVRTLDELANLLAGDALGRG